MTNKNGKDNGNSKSNNNSRSLRDGNKKATATATSRQWQQQSLAVLFA
jgi:hypothetical protein